METDYQRDLEIIWDCIIQKKEDEHGNRYVLRMWSEFSEGRQVHRRKWIPLESMNPDEAKCILFRIRNPNLPGWRAN